ncbi:MAG: effector-associated domain EAD1-containing protein [Caldilineaceae bacterium]
MTELRDICAALYPKEPDTRTVVFDAGVDASRIAFSARAQTNWQNILDEAIRQERLDALILVIRKAYGRNARLQAVLADYDRFVAAGGRFEISTRTEVLDKSRNLSSKTRIEISKKTWLVIGALIAIFSLPWGFYIYLPVQSNRDPTTTAITTDITPVAITSDSNTQDKRMTTSTFAALATFTPTATLALSPIEISQLSVISTSTQPTVTSTAPDNTFPFVSQTCTGTVERASNESKIPIYKSQTSANQLLQTIPTVREIEVTIRDKSKGLKVRYQIDYIPEGATSRVIGWVDEKYIRLSPNCGDQFRP